MILSSPVLKPPVAVREPFADMVVGNPSPLHIRYQLHAQAFNPSIIMTYSDQAHNRQAPYIPAHKGTWIWGHIRATLPEPEEEHQELGAS